MRDLIYKAAGDAREEIIGLGRKLQRIPELGFKEFKTAAAVAEVFKANGIPHTDGIAITGVKAELTGGKTAADNTAASVGAAAAGESSSPTVCVMGEMDAIPCPEHPLADPETGAAHACGHNAGLAAMLGAALILKNSGVMEKLSGRAVFLAAPAEEFIELEYRLQLVREGKLSRLSGKQEMLALGVFDDVDYAMMIHANCAGPFLTLGQRSMGFCVKRINFIGREAHAAAAPHEGINALNAAAAAQMLIQAQRETFRDEDGIRVHPIITKGGDAVNSVPADARMETYVRGWRQEGIADASVKVERALEGAAHAFGAGLKVERMDGYMPLRQDNHLNRLMAEEAERLYGADFIRYGGDFSGSTDAGDVSQKIKMIHPALGGFTGSVHGRDFAVADEELAYVTPAKLMALTAARICSL